MLKKFMKFKGKKVAIVGFGLEGKATYNFLKNKGVTITVFDDLNESELRKRYGYGDFSKLKAKFVLGGNYPVTLKGFDMIVRTPFARPDKKEFNEATENGAVLTSQIKLFFDLCPSRIVGVTGTKGKGTTSTLIYKMLKESGKDVYLGGNIGVPALSFLGKLKNDSIAVLELSSFQLMDLGKSPNAAVILNVTSEHLDWHKSTKEYKEAKSSLVRFQNKNNFVITNGEYKSSREYAKFSKGEKFYFSKRESDKDGCFVDKDRIVLKLGGKVLDICSTDEIGLRGRHNLENVTAATIAAYLNGAELFAIRKVIRSFKGLPYRLEFVRRYKGAMYFNDSFSTVPETAIAAIKSFDEPKILIAGGSYKGSNYKRLGQIIRKNNVRTLLLIGKMAGEIEKAVKEKSRSYPKIIKGLKNMREIVRIAKKEAEKGDVVLLSPACASFDMFKDYKDRGNQFKEEVRKLGLRNLVT